MAITYRLTKGLPLTNAEIDDNFQFIEDELNTKLDSASYTAANVLSKLLTVDTDAAGINATTLRSLAPATANTVSTIVQRDSSGNFSASTITASLTGNVTGNVTGDIRANNGTTVLDNGTDGTNATFTGRVNNVTLTSASIGFTVAGGTTSKTLTVSNTLTLTGTDASSVAFGSGGTVAYTGASLAQFAATTSSQLAGVISDETGSGALVFATSPSLTTPSLGVATATSINRLTITQPASSATLTIANGKTLTASNTLTLSGTDGSSVAFGSGGTIAYTGSTLAQFAATTSSQLAGVISDETGSGALVFGTSPTLGTPIITSPRISYANIVFTLDGNITIDANGNGVRTSWISSFTAGRILSVDNLSSGREIKVLMRNTNGTARAHTIQCRTTAAGAYTAVSIIARASAASVSSVTLAATSGTALVTIVNIGDAFYADY